MKKMSLEINRVLSDVDHLLSGPSSLAPCRQPRELQHCPYAAGSCPYFCCPAHPMCSGCRGFLTLPQHSSKLLPWASHELFPLLGIIFVQRLTGLPVCLFRSRSDVPCPWRVSLTVLDKGERPPRDTLTLCPSLNFVFRLRT